MGLLCPNSGSRCGCRSFGAATTDGRQRRCQSLKLPVEIFPISAVRVQERRLTSSKCRPNVSRGVPTTEFVLFVKLSPGEPPGASLSNQASGSQGSQFWTETAEKGGVAEGELSLTDRFSSIGSDQAGIIVDGIASFMAGAACEALPAAKFRSLQSLIANVRQQSTASGLRRRRWGLHTRAPLTIGGQACPPHRRPVLDTAWQDRRRWNLRPVIDEIQPN